MVKKKDEEVNEVAEVITDLFISAMAKFRKKNNDSREVGIHISNITGDCMRKAYYDIGLKDSYRGMDLGGFMKTSMGLLVHEIGDLGGKNEFPLHITSESGIEIFGTCDNLVEVNGGLVIQDTKTTSSDYMMKDTNKGSDVHWKQLDYYTAMLWKMGEKVPDFQSITYFLVGDDSKGRGVLPSTKCRRFDSERLEEIYKDMVHRAELLMDSLKNKKLPGKGRGWMCAYCEHFEICGGNVEIEEINPYGIEVLNLGIKKNVEKCEEKKEVPEVPEKKEVKKKPVKKEEVKKEEVKKEEVKKEEVKKEEVKKEEVKKESEKKESEKKESEKKESEKKPEDKKEIKNPKIRKCLGIDTEVDSEEIFSGKNWDAGGWF